MHGEDDLRTDQEVSVVISTSSKVPVSFKVYLYETTDFSTGINEYSRVNGVTVSSPEYRYVDFSRAEDNTLLNVKVESGDESVCAIVSVQPHNCPVSDLEETVRNEGSFQTMLKIASFNIERKLYGSGVYIVFLVLSDDSLCGNYNRPSASRSKNFHFEITDDLSKDQIALKVFLSVLFLSGLGLVTVVAHCLFSVYGKKLEKRLEKIRTEDTDGSAYFSGRQRKDDATDGDREGPETLPMRNLEAPSPSSSGTSRRALPRFVDELSKKGSDKRQQKLFKSMFQKSDLYVWLVITMGMFYTIPAIQVVINQQDKLRTTGDQDICYYNFLCSIPVKEVTDFNHIFSNIWYLGFGMLFIFLTGYRQWQHGRFLEKLDEAGVRPVFGIPQHFGIYYAMGIAIVFEGVLSACYHVCPTNENFQFDTTFMYVIATLGFIKIYQFRHPDISVNSYKVFLGLGVVMFAEVMGIYFDSTVFWVLSLIGYFLVCVILSSIFYHSGQWSLNHSIFFNIFYSVKNLLMTRECSENYSTKRLIIVLLLNFLNIVLILFGAILRPGISTYLLAVFICNLIFYTAYYITMKIIYKEKFTIKPIGYSLAAIACWVPALYYFNMTQYSSEVTPAESRNINEECLVGGMSDAHDIWHMMSAAGLFFTLMMLMTLDDGLFHVPRNKIHIF